MFKAKPSKYYFSYRLQRMVSTYVGIIIFFILLYIGNNILAPYIGRETSNGLASLIGIAGIIISTLALLFSPSHRQN